MSFRLTALERAYQLARSGACRTVTDVRQTLVVEGYERVQDALYGPALVSDLRKLCQAHYVPPDDGNQPSA